VVVVHIVDVAAVLSHVPCSISHVYSAHLLLMQEDICVKLGVSATLAAVLQAWVHLKQYLQHGDLRILVQAKRHLKAYADTAPCSSTNGDASLRHRDLLSESPPVPSSTQSALVRAAIKRELLRQANDAFLECKPEQVPHVFDMLLFASGVPTAQRPQELESMFKKSLDLELDRCWQSACQVANGSNTGPLSPRRRSNMSVFILTVEVRHKATGTLP
jgi:hypothetical protein